MQTSGLKHNVVIENHNFMRKFLHQNLREQAPLNKTITLSRTKLKQKLNKKCLVKSVIVLTLHGLIATSSTKEETQKLLPNISK
jgi:hypothetical protein